MQQKETLSKREIEFEYEQLLDEWRPHMERLMDQIIDTTITTRISKVSVSEWAEEHRILPGELSSLPGPFRFNATPYLREIADCFSESSPVSKVCIQKGTQIGATVGILENLVGYIIDVAPGPSLFISGDRDMAQAQMALRIDRMIFSAGLQDRIFSQVEKKNNRATGDTRSRKDFPGGFLIAAGPNTGSKLRSLSVKYLLFDEVDAYPAEVQGEGDPVALAERRTDSYERVRKILYISTPLIAQSSKIERLFHQGDQRYFMVPCKHCGAMQPLKWSQMRFNQTEDGRLDWESVRYECEECAGEWTNDDKAFFLPRGEWRPTAEPSEPGFRSYHISALYSPIGFRSWESVCNQWAGIGDDVSLRRNFINTVLGETWEERGEAPPPSQIMVRAMSEELHSNEIPPEALFLTIGADVQKDRIEAELVAWGKDKESWSVDYMQFWGDTNDLGSLAWRGLQDFIEEPRAKPVLVTLIDSGFRTTTVYSFTERFGEKVLPCMGKSGTGQPFRLFAVKGYKTRRVDLRVDQFKSELYGYLQRGVPVEGEDYPRGYCHFPVDRPESWFRSLVSEELVPERKRSGRIVYTWKKIHERNEALDCRVYNMGAVEVLRHRTAEYHGVEAVDWPTFWELAEKAAKKREKAGAAGY